jgi:hypothetical protein
MTQEPPATQPTDRGEKYRRTIRETLKDRVCEIEITVDVYDVLSAFNITCPATQHAIKKLLLPGGRGAKDKIRDLQEAAVSIQRAIQLETNRP